MHASWFRPGAGERRFVPCPGTFLCWFGGARAYACHYFSPRVEGMPAHLRPGGDPRLGRDGKSVKVDHRLSFIIMAEENRESMKPELAIALARGISVTAWARARGVPRPTAYRWSKDPKVRKAIDAFRCRSIGQSGCCLEKPPGRSAGSPGSRIVPSRSRCA